MNTQQKGDLAVTMAIAKLTELGYNISLPITESAQYDLIIEKDMILKRVQVKYSKSIDVDLRRIHSNSKGYVIKNYKNGFDYLFVMQPNKNCYLVKRNTDGKGSIRPKKSELI